VLELVRLEDRADDFLNTYSGGMRRRLEIARGLLHYPQVLFLDEPTIGLDPQSREHIWEYIKKLRKQENMTIILTTHYMEEADRLCDRVAIIDHGKIVALDQPSVLKSGVGGDMIILGTDDTGLLHDLLAQNRMTDHIQVGNREVRATVSNASILLPRIIEAAVKADIYITSIHLIHPDMNDVFIHYTGKDLRQDQGRERFGRMAMMKRRRMR
jgi:ABC-2 type transport system ATP-binding protein